MKTGIIYCYFNPISGKRYIGQTTDERNRRSAFRNKELYCTRLGEGGKLSKFDAARKKYGVDTFVYSVLCKIEDDDEQVLHLRLDDLEKYYIKKYDSFHNGYNSTEGGFSGKLSEETKAKISESLKGRPMSKLTYQKLCLTGYPHTEESKRKISEKLRNVIKILLNTQCLENIIQKKVNVRTQNPERESVQEQKMEKVNQFYVLLNLESLLKNLPAKGTLVNGWAEIENLTHKFQTVVEVRLKQLTDTFGNLKNKLWLKEKRRKT